jgi:hypothetical protein
MVLMEECFEGRLRPLAHGPRAWNLLDRS